MIERDGMIISGPTYFSDLTTNMKAFIDCAGYVARANQDMLRRKFVQGYGQY
ncbi:MAG: NAD(P)H-dependent oxidoreductase [Planctomycetota bacterium]